MHFPEGLEDTPLRNSKSFFKFDKPHQKQHTVYKQSSKQIGFIVLTEYTFGTCFYALPIKKKNGV